MLSAAVRPSHPSNQPAFRFGPYEVDVARRELRKFGVRIPLERKPWTLLLTLLEDQGKCVSREELQAALWPDGTFVDYEHGINVAVKKLRSALCDSAEAPVYIETVPGEGYRFIGSVIREGTVKESTSYSLVAASMVDHDPELERVYPGQRSKPAWRIAFVVLILVVLMGGAWVARARRMPKAIPHATNVSLQRFLYVADYSGNGVVTYKIDPFNGSLKQVSETRSGEHPYDVAVLDGDFVYVANRGRADQVCGQGCTVSAYAIDKISGSLTELDGSPFAVGTAPLALAVHPSGKFLYVTDVVNHLYVYERHGDGGLRRMGEPIAVGMRPFYVGVAPSGKFVYVANQDDATIHAFSVDPEGSLHPVPGSPFSTGLRPRSLLFHPNGRFVYAVNYGVDPFENRESACSGSYGSARGRGCNVSVFAVDTATGALSRIAGSPFESDGTNPLAAVMDGEGRYLFVANITSNNVSVFSVDATTGAIRRVEGSPFAAGEGPSSLTLDAGGFLYVLNTQAHSLGTYSVDFSSGRLVALGATPVPGLGATSVAAQRGAGR